jgi:aryl-alcohol dehydrogenase-like predicted oxidoreductase
MTSPTVDELIGRGTATAGVARFILGGAFASRPLEDSFRLLDHFAAAGGCLVETARSYGKGREEIALGRWLGANPGVLRVITKIGHDPVDGKDIPLERALVREHVRASLEALRVGSIDLLLYHGDDLTRGVPELAETLLGLVEDGFVRQVGASNWQADRFAQLARELAPAGHRPVGSYQFSLATPDPDRLRPGNLAADAAVRAVLDKLGLPLFCWSAQATGFFARTAPKEGKGPWRLYETPQNIARRRRCTQLAAELGCRPEIVALAWVLHRPNAWPAIGPRTVEQFGLSSQARQIELTETQRSWLASGD